MDSKAMNAASSIKMLVLATSQYLGNQNETTKSQLLRHIEVLLAVVKSVELYSVFDKNNAFGRQCFFNLMEVVANCNKDPLVMDKIFKLFSVVIDVPFSRKLIFETIDVISPLIMYVVEYSSNDSTHPVQECLFLLEKATYDFKVSDSTCHLDKFISCIIKQIADFKNIHIAALSLSILSNLVAHNLAIQAQVKSMIALTQMKCFMKYLREDSMANKVSVLSIITHICWDDDLTKKLYSVENIGQTIKLLFSRLSAFDDLLTQHRAADLCTELLKRDDIAEQFSLIYETEQNYGSRLLLILQKAVHPLAACKILEVLLAICQIPNIRRGMCNKMLEWNQAWQIILKVASSSLSKHHAEPSILALSLIKELCDEMVNVTLDLVQPSWFEALISMTTKQLLTVSMENQSSVSDFFLKFEIIKQLKSIQILKSLCNDEKLIEFVAREINSSALSQLIDHQLTFNTAGISQTTYVDWNDVGVDLVLNSLDLVFNLKHISSNLQKLLYSKLQDTRLVPFIARAITGCDRPRIQTALKLYQESLPLPDFPLVLLAETIGGINERTAFMFPSFNTTPLPSFKQSVSLKNTNLQSTLLKNIANGRHDIPARSSSMSNYSDSEEKENIQSLIDNVETVDTEENLKKCSINKKTSEIMEIYENKISCLKTKESQLQDLLEVKTVALSQADRLIVQYRCQQARYEDDAKRMAEILRESEIRSEELIESCRNADKEKGSLERELQTVVEENRNLQKVADQYDKMQCAFQDKSHKIEVLERNLKTSRQEYDTLKELHDMIQKHNEKMKQQHNQAASRLEEVEEERMKLLKRVSELENSVSDLTQLVETQDQAAHLLMQEKAERDVAIKNLNLQINKRDEDIKELKIRISSQESTRQQTEHQLKERQSEIKRLNNTIESLYKKVESLNSEIGHANEALMEKDCEITKLKQKSEKLSQTLSMITELGLSNNIRGSQ